MMLGGSSETAVTWGASEPEGGTQRRVRLKGGIRESRRQESAG